MHDLKKLAALLEESPKLTESELLGRMMDLVEASEYNDELNVRDIILLSRMVRNVTFRPVAHA